MLNKKDYEAMAGIIKSLADNDNNISRDDLVEHLSEYFECNNPNFDRDKFYQACYTKE